MSDQVAAVVSVSPWDQHPFYATPEGFRDETFDFVYELTAGASQTLPNLALAVDADSDFLLRSFIGEFMPSAGLADVRFTDPTGNMMSSDFLIWDELVGTLLANSQSPVYPEVRVPAEGLMLVDVRETSGAGSVSIRLVLSGVKRCAVGTPTGCPVPGGGA